MRERLLWILNGAIRFGIVGFILALLGCAPPQTPVQVTATRAVVTPLAETQTPLVASVTETVLPPTFTPLPATSELSQTPVPLTTTLTSEPMATLVPANSVEPFTQGSILYLWNEEPPPPPEEAPGRYELGPTVGAYLAQPGATPSEWNIKPLLTDIRAFPPAFPSPDQTKLALLILEDSERFVNGIYRIHVYSFADGSLERVENQENAYNLSWLPNNESFTYSQFTNIALTNLKDLQVELLTNNPTEPIEDAPFNTISQLAGSPNGQLQAMIVSTGIGLGDSRRMPGQNYLAFFDIAQSETITVTEVPGDSFPTLKWSPDSQWLAYTHDFGQGLFVVNVNDLTVSELATEPTSIYYPSWSPDGRQLAFTQSSKLSLWNSETETTNELTRTDYLSEPSWSPDSSHIAAGFIEGNKAGIMVVDPSTGNRQDLILETFTNSVIWSPDGQWLLFQLVQSDRSGLYVMNIEEGVPYLILDTSGKLHGLEYITWLSSTSTLP